jgi:hypothetical protein
MLSFRGINDTKDHGFSNFPTEHRKVDTMNRIYRGDIHEEFVDPGSTFNPGFLSRIEQDSQRPEF